MAITNARLLGALISCLPEDIASSLLKARVLTTHYNKASVLALNAILLDAPEALTESFADETVSIICQGIAHSQQTSFRWKRKVPIHEKILGSRSRRGRKEILPEVL